MLKLIITSGKSKEVEDFSVGRLKLPILWPQYFIFLSGLLVSKSASFGVNDVKYGQLTTIYSFLSLIAGNLYASRAKAAQKSSRCAPCGMCEGPINYENSLGISGITVQHFCCVRLCIRTMTVITTNYEIASLKFLCQHRA